MASNATSGPDRVGTPLDAESLERRLVQASERLNRLRTELSIAEEQAHALEEEAEDCRLRALVSETPLADRSHREARRHADAMARHVAELRRSVATLEDAVDELLDRRSGSR